MSELRIVHYLSSMDLRDGGVVRAVLDLCPALVRAGHRVELLTCDDRDVPAEWRDPHASGTPRCVRLEPLARGGRLSGAAAARVGEVVAGADVVHLHAMWIPSNARIASICWTHGTPYVISPHGMLDDWCMAQKPWKKRLYHTLVERRTLEHAAGVHCTAEAELEQARKWFSGATGEVVPLPFDLADYRDLPGPEAARARFGLTTDRPTLLFLSRLHPKKGVGVLVRAVAAMRDAGRPVRLVIAGGGDAAYERELRALVPELKLQDEVIFAGFVKGREKVSLYQAADVFVLPSSQENFGYVVVEAMAAGTPVITTRGVALWPQLERERIAVLAEPEVDALCAAIRGVLEDPAASREMAARGRAWCMRELDPARIIQQFVEMYRRAAATRPATGAGAP